MSRRLRPLGSMHLDALPCVCPGCVFWESERRLDICCGAACDSEKLKSWYSLVAQEWGECGRVAYEDDQVLGFIKYAPPRYFPQARHFPSGPPRDDAVLLTCVHIRDDARQRGLGSLLLRAALRDLALRGEKRVQAYACAVPADMTEQPVMGVEFLLRNGFTVARPDARYPLLELDLRTLVTLTENIEAALQTLRIPLRRTAPVPSPSIKSE